MKIYWANSLFSDADRMFNSICVEKLRNIGYSIYLPQEQPFNHEEIPTSSEEIFRSDTNQILSCDVLIACIDQESIDSGVACEIGIAWAHKKTIIGLYTDIRQYKAYLNDEGKMYKNLYVIGCIRESGIIAKSIQDIDEYLNGNIGTK